MDSTTEPVLPVLPTIPYDWKITIVKGLKILGHIAIAGIFAVYTNDPWLVALAPVLSMLDNWLNHA